MEGLQENIFKSELAKPADVATLLDQMKLAIEGKKKNTIKSLIRQHILLAFIQVYKRNWPM